MGRPDMGVNQGLGTEGPKPARWFPDQALAVRPKNWLPIHRSGVTAPMIMAPSSSVRLGGKQPREQNAEHRHNDQ